MLNLCLIRGQELLHATPHGTLGLERSREALCQLLAEGTEGAGDAPGAYDLLFDVREADIAMELTEVWALLEDLDECNPGFDGRLALLDHWDPWGDTFDRMQFFEASSERIGVEAKAFLEFEKAVDWLWARPTRSRAKRVAGDS